ncbi:MAG: hypothetical protein JNJ40_12665 [Bacteroidia bacterium]|nr:hypothetical protein [Bacteroidia bacterium]
MDQIPRINKHVTNYQLYSELEVLINEVSDLKKNLKPIKKQKRYNYKDAAELLCITVEGLKTRVKRGQIQRISNGATPMISHEEIERFLKKQNPDFQKNNDANY